MRVGIIIQARTQSARLPRKVLAPIGGATLIERLIRRMALSTRSSALIVATGAHAANQPIADLCCRLGVVCHAGPDDDCLARTILAARALGIDTVVRVTADNPLTDPGSIDEWILRWQSTDLDYLDNISADGDPHGAGYEIIGRDALEFSHDTWTMPENREHVTWGIRRHLRLFRHERVCATPPRHRPQYRFSVDYPEDLEVVKRIYQAFGWRDDMRLDEINAYLDAHPEIARLNSGRGEHLPTPKDLEAWQLPDDGIASEAWSQRSQARRRMRCAS